MYIDQMFLWVNTLALLGWLLYLFLPRARWMPSAVIGVIVALLAIDYAVLIFTSFPTVDFAKMGTLDRLMELFGSKEAVLTGWVHYLAFDLMAGWFVLKNGQRHGVAHAWLVPCLLGCFMLGPIGLLLFLIVRTIKTKKYFSTGINE